MSASTLTLIHAHRTEFGFARTVCACAECVQNCRHIPGYLIPADLERIQKQLAPNEDLLVWAKKNLLASPGALVAYRGKAYRIPTLVPARRMDGACRFLTTEDRCAIHAVAPFGCAFFDSHQPSTEADQRSLRGLQAILEAWRCGGPYVQVWLALKDEGLQAPAPEMCRQQLNDALDQKKIG